MNIGHLLFQTHGALDKRTWWKAQIFIWLFSAFTFWIYMKFGFHDALFISIFVAGVFLVENKREHQATA